MTNSTAIEERYKLLLKASRKNLKLRRHLEISELIRENGSDALAKWFFAKLDLQDRCQEELKGRYGGSE